MTLLPGGRSRWLPGTTLPWLLPVGWIEPEFDHEADLERQLLEDDRRRVGNPPDLVRRYRDELGDPWSPRAGELTRRESESGAR